MNSVFGSTKLSIHITELQWTLHRNSALIACSSVPSSPPWRTFHSNSSLLRWEEPSKHCNPTPYQGLKKLGREEARPWLANPHNTKQTGLIRVQLLRRNIPGYQEKFTLRRVVDNTGPVPPFQLHLSHGLTVQLPLTHGWEVQLGTLSRNNATCENPQLLLSGQTIT